LYRARHHQADLPARLAQFKRQINRGILTRGGGRVSRGRLTHVILQGKRFRLAPNPYPLTARRPIASELVEGRTGSLAASLHGHSVAASASRSPAAPTPPWPPAMRACDKPSVFSVARKAVLLGVFALSRPGE